MIAQRQNAVMKLFGCVIKCFSTGILLMKLVKLVVTRVTHRFGKHITKITDNPLALLNETFHHKTQENTVTIALNYLSTTYLRL